MSEYLERAKKLKEYLDELNAFKTRAEGQLDQLLKQKSQIEDDIRDMGLAPEQIDATISELENSISKLMEEANNIIPHNILKEIAAK